MNPGDITFFTTISDNGHGGWTVHVGKLPDGTFVGWGPHQTKADATLLTEGQIDYFGLLKIKKCPTCGRETR